MFSEDIFLVIKPMQKLARKCCRAIKWS